MKSRKDLQEKIVTAFKESPEIYNILLFGSEVSGNVHERSDIDLILASKDLLQTAQTYRPILEKSIGRIRGMWRIVNEPEERVESIMLEYAGIMDAYWKIDLTILSDLSRKDAFRPLKSLWRREGNDGFSETYIERLPDLHPLEEGISYVLFNAPRFLKSFYTHDPAVYMRWHRIIENLEILLLEKLHDWNEGIEGSRIHGGQRAWLKKNVTGHNKERFDKVFPPTGELEVFKSGIEALLWFMELAKEKAVRFSVPLNKEWLTFMEEFILWERKNLYKK